ncbi:MAG: AI-2E family transporter [Rhodocyclaceae bacterium]|nr:AI-2E family transporter [Rhodocyclaceae bacterium]MBX3667497.1 AI-2E family transporter [Rhodocyclaceae bacterium]
MHETPSRPHQIAAWLLAAGALVAVLRLHLIPALLAGLTVFELVHILAQRMKSRIFGQRARLIAVALLSAVVVAGVVAAIAGLLAFFRSEAGNLHSLLQKMADIVEGSRTTMPPWLVERLPDTAEEIKEALAHWLREHGPEVQVAGKEFARGAAHVLIGLVVGAMLALRETLPLHEYRPLAAALVCRGRRIAEAFRRVVLAQVRISALNTAFTAVYLALVLPLFDVHLPLVKTMIAITFVVGLLAVIGNLISNTVIVIISLSHSLSIALASLAFLVVIHKLEYFLNARIVGSRIHSRAWELLLAMLVMESAFGLPGLIVAPLYYAYLKDELSSAGQV